MIITNCERDYATTDATSTTFVCHNWYALYVKSRHEFVTRMELAEKGIDTFLPSVRRMSQWKDRKKEVEFPLFPGYLFVFISADPEAYLNVLKTRGAVRLLSAKAGYPTPVSTEEIDSLKLLIESGEEIDIYPHLKEGERVRIRRGALKGAVGTIGGKQNQNIFLVNIEILGRSVGVKIYPGDIEAD